MRSRSPRPAAAPVGAFGFCLMPIHVVVVCVLVVACGSPDEGGGASLSSPSVVAHERAVTGELAEVDEIRRMAGCLNDRGIVTSIDEDGTGYSADYGALDRDQFVTILDECKEATGFGAAPPARLSRDEIAAVYDRWHVTADCLTEQGYEVAEPSSVEAFVDGWPTGEMWHPYEYVVAESQEEWDRLNRLCPQ